MADPVLSLLQNVKQKKLENQEVLKQGGLIYPLAYSVIKGCFPHSEEGFEASSVQATFLKSFQPISALSKKDGWADLIKRINELNDEAKLTSATYTYKLIFLTSSAHGHVAMANAEAVPYDNKYDPNEDENQKSPGMQNNRKEANADDAMEVNVHEPNTEGEVITDPEDEEEVVDPGLTTLGKEQALHLGRIIKEQLQKGAPFPGIFYASPSKTATETLQLSWNVANAKEGNNAANFGEHVESISDLHKRTRNVLDMIFMTERSTCVSITTHAKNIEALFEIVGHPKFQCPDGCIIPVVIKAEGHWVFSEVEVEVGSEGYATITTPEPHDEEDDERVVVVDDPEIGECIYPYSIIRRKRSALNESGEACGM